MLVGFLITSIGFNILAFNYFSETKQIADKTNSPVSDQELHKMMEEVKRLSKQTYTNNDSTIQYNIKTKEPISNDF
jgi:hypothetical protein